MSFRTDYSICMFTTVLQVTLLVYADAKGMEAGYTKADEKEQEWYL